MEADFEYTYIFSFEKLDVWKNSVILVKEIYLLTKDFPGDEKYGLVSQMRRASISVSSNLAEGTSRNTNADKSHFTTISYSSLMELLNQLIISTELKFMQEEKLFELKKLISHIANQLNNLRKSQKSN